MQSWGRRLSRDNAELPQRGLRYMFFPSRAGDVDVCEADCVYMLGLFLLFICIAFFRC